MKIASASPIGAERHCGLPFATCPYNTPSSPSVSSSRSGKGVAIGPSAVAVTRLASRAARIVARMLSRSSSLKAGGMYMAILRSGSGRYFRSGTIKTASLRKFWDSVGGAGSDTGQLDGYETPWQFRAARQAGAGVPQTARENSDGQRDQSAGGRRVSG